MAYQHISSLVEIRAVILLFWSVSKIPSLDSFPERARCSWMFPSDSRPASNGTNPDCSSQMPSSDTFGIPCCLLCLVLFIDCVTFDIFRPCIAGVMRVLPCHPGWPPPHNPSALASWVTRVTAPAHSTASWFYCDCLFNMKVCTIILFVCGRIYPIISETMILILISGLLTSSCKQIFYLEQMTCSYWKESKDTESCVKSYPSKWSIAVFSIG